MSHAPRPLNDSDPASAPAGRRRFLGLAAGLAAGAALGPSLSAFAEDMEMAVKGPPVRDIAPLRLTPRVWVIQAPDGFPTPENHGMMANVTFVSTGKGVVVIDSGASVQIGEMAIRQLKKLTDEPVVAIFNSHYHGDHYLGNQAFVDAFGAGKNSLPIYAHAETIKAIRGHEGESWRAAMERWTNLASAGTRVVPPNTAVDHGQEFRIGDRTFRLHHLGHAHTPGDISVEVVEDGVTHVGDIAMDRRIANMDDGSYVDTFKTYDMLIANTRTKVWIPAHGVPSAGVLQWNRELFAGIYETCVQAVQDGLPLEAAKARVLKDPRVASRAAETKGFDNNIGKYVSLAYLEAEAASF
ncbi:MBL fold metallo-hydrolase [Oryzomicrobium sp.]|uniref:MBL fold metallo-hydrolase n=1 Tax=Oryzomicrobium sp. TaxID=1911578 RepID=UPI0025E66DC2|nr:MBL fold metallo-hydrolase [Oryzomicrobium sp.]MCE1242940.1 MBL fold metallo-hydrolase [Oryzomicrobium sp.]